MATTVNKVLAYITREDELLVFQHRDFPEAGLQVPAGTIEDGESPQDAVLWIEKARIVNKPSSRWLPTGTWLRKSA